MDRFTSEKVGCEFSQLKKLRIWRIQIRIHNIFKIYQRTNRKYPSRETFPFKENNGISLLFVAMVMLYLSVPLSPEYVSACLWSGLRSFHCMTRKRRFSHSKFLPFLAIIHYQWMSKAEHTVSFFFFFVHSFRFYLAGVMARDSRIKIL